MFGDDYARAYDAIYADKDYDSECRALIAAMEAHGYGPGSRLLDVGCGTGRHAVQMAKAGYHVTGTDRSVAMLDIARERAREGFVVWDTDEAAESGAQFDVVYSLFDVLSYQVATEQTVDFVSGLMQATRPGGVVIFDSWHTAGLVTDPPKAEQTREFLSPQGRITRSSTSRVDWVNTVTHIDYNVTIADGGSTKSFSETHVMRSFTVAELLLLSAYVGLSDAQVVPSPSMKGPVSAADWHVAVIGRRS